MKNGQFKITDFQKNITQMCTYRNDQILGEIEQYSNINNELVFKGQIIKGKKNGLCFIKTERFIYEGNYVDDKK